MNPRSVKLLTLLTSEKMRTIELAEKLGASYKQTTAIVNLLIKDEFLKKEGGAVSLAVNPHAVFFKRLSKRYDMVKLIGDSSETVAFAILQQHEVHELQKTIGVSTRTINRSLSKMMETGAVRLRDGGYYLADDEDLRIFLKMWKEARDRRRTEPYAEVIYSSGETVIKKIPHVKLAKGALTAFSAFWSHGVEIHPVQDYYIQRDRNPSLEEVLVHALVASASPIEVTDCAVLLAKNLDRINLGEARIIAKGFGVESLLLDLENYVRDLPVAHPERFLPWHEYEEKARLYDVDPIRLLPREAYPDFFRLLGERLSALTEAYLFGGEAMRIRGLKRATKDIDITLEDMEAFKRLEETLSQLGYSPLGGEVSEVDQRLEASGIYVSGSYPRVDVFVKRICGAFTLSENMKQRAEGVEMGNLRLQVASNEDLFLLKSITEREGDIIDMATLAGTPEFNWKTVYAELLHQEEDTNRNYSRDLLDAVELVEKTGIKSPIHNQLVNRSLDQAIVEVIDRQGSTSLRGIRSLVNYPDHRIRSRITRLVKEGLLAANGDRTYRRATKAS